MPLYALGDREPSIHPDAYVHPDAVVIGDVELGAEASVWPTAVLRGDDGRIVVGARTSIQDGSIIHTTGVQDTIIGADVTVGHNVHIEAATIGDHALISSGSVVLNGATIGEGAVVAAGAVVSPNATIPPRRMALGIPARVREGHELPERVAAHAVEFYVARGTQYRAQLRRLDGCVHLTPPASPAAAPCVHPTPPASPAADPGVHPTPPASPAAGPGVHPTPPASPAAGP